MIVIKRTCRREGRQVVVDFSGRHLQAIKFHTALLEKMLRQGVVVVGEDHHTNNAHCNQRLCAGSARQIRHIRRGAGKRLSMACRLANRIHLRMVGPHAMVVHNQAPGIIAMGRAGQRAVVAGGEYMVVLHQHASAVHPRAGRALRGQHRQLQEIRIPLRTPGGCSSRPEFDLRFASHFLPEDLLVVLRAMSCGSACIERSCSRSR